MSLNNQNIILVILFLMCIYVFMKSDNFICCIFDSRTVAGLQFSQFKLVLPTGTMSGASWTPQLLRPYRFGTRPHPLPGRVGSRFFRFFQKKYKFRDLLKRQKLDF